jgi:allantoate deiminase
MQQSDVTIFQASTGLAGATHDASAMSDLCPIAMLFVQSKDGLSHNPKEFSKETDMQVAVRVLENLITNLKV